MDLTDTYKAFHPATAEEILCNRPLFSKIEHILDYKTSLNTYERNNLMHLIIMGGTQKATTPPKTQKLHKLTET